LSDKDKSNSIAAVKELAELGFKLYATAGTHNLMNSNDVKTELVAKHADKSENPQSISAVDLINKNQISLVINTPFGRGAQRDGRLIRTAAVQRGVPCITTVPGLKAAVEGIRALQQGGLTAKSIQEWHKQ
jgi:carbamoyl-phosphate synthase large subunit